MTEKPNVLLIVIDQFRADLLDGRLAETANLKNLNALAEECCFFRNHFTVVTPCGPSRVSLFTGQYARNHRAVRNGTPLRHDTPNLALQMRSVGYDPLLFGYTDVTQDPRVLEADDPRLNSYEEVLPGFAEVVRHRQDTDVDAWRRYLSAKGYDVPEGNGIYVPAGETIDAPALYRSEDSDTAFLTDQFLEHMGDANKGWFAALTYIRPHPPFVAPEPFNRRYCPDKIPAPLVHEDSQTHAFVEAVRQTKPVSGLVEGFPDLEASADTVNTIRSLYLGLAAEVDHHIGRVVDWLKSSNQWDDTILVVTADHGEMLGDFGVWGKGTVYDAAYHVPLMIRAPGQQPRRFDGMSESIDVTPTILDLVGAEIPDAMNGSSLRSAMETGKGGKSVSFSELDFGDPIYPTEIQKELGLSACAANLAILRSQTHRLVHFAADLPQIVFDITRDGEARDVSSLPEGEAFCLDLSRKMLCHALTHPESTFAWTMVTETGVKRRTGQVSGRFDNASREHAVADNGHDATEPKEG